MTATLDAALDSAIDHLDDHAPAGTSSQLPPAPARPAAVTLGSIDQLIALAQRSPVKRVKALADKVAAEVAELRQRIVDAAHAEQERRRRDEAKAAAREEVAKLERQLAAAKARLKPRPVRPRQTPPVSELACPVPGCGRTFGGRQAVAMHRRRAHDGFDPNAAK